MAAVRLLCVFANRALADEINLQVRAIEGCPYTTYHAVDRDQFLKLFSALEPDLIIADEEGVPGLKLKEIACSAARTGDGVPLVVVGNCNQRIHQRTRELRLLSQGTACYLRRSEMNQLPTILKHSLSEQSVRDQERQRLAALMQENQRLATIGRMAGWIAHEINNPLESVINLHYLIAQEPNLSPEVRSYLEMADSELSRVVEIAKKTLSFYREAPTPSPVRLSTLMNEVLVLYGRKLQEKKIQVIHRFAGETPIIGRPGEIRQAFANLIGNAIDASGENAKLYLRIRPSRLWRDPKVMGLRVTIADTGTGIAPEIRRRLGKPFFTTKGQAGTGLGLWVTQSILRTYGGHLAMRSATGEPHGTAFALFLPTNLHPQAISRGPKMEDNLPGRPMRHAKGA